MQALFSKQTSREMPKKPQPTTKTVLISDNKKLRAICVYKHHTVTKEQNKNTFQSWQVR